MFGLGLAAPNGEDRSIVSINLAKSSSSLTNSDTETTGDLVG